MSGYFSADGDTLRLNTDDVGETQAVNIYELRKRCLKFLCNVRKDKYVAILYNTALDALYSIQQSVGAPVGVARNGTILDTAITSALLLPDRFVSDVHNSVVTATSDVLAKYSTALAMAERRYYEAGTQFSACG